MSSDDDIFLDRVVGKLRKKKGFCPPTPEEAEAAYDEAPSIPMSEDELDALVAAATAEDEEAEWQEEEEMEAAEEWALQLYRKPGAGDAEAKKAETELEDEMLNDGEEDKT